MVKVPEDKPMSWIACSLLALLPWAPDDVFQQGSFEEVRAAARADERPLLVVFEAEGSVPCATMDATTWCDERVAAWIAEHALAVRVDAAARADLVAEHAITELPTVLCLLGDVEPGRLVGLQTAEQLLAALEKLSTFRELAEQALSRMEDQAADDQPGPKELYRLMYAGELDALGALALQLLDDDGSDASTDVPAGHAMRSMLGLLVKGLVLRKPGLREPFEQRAAALELAVRGGSQDFRTFHDWVQLAVGLGQGDRIVAFVEERLLPEGGLRAVPAEWMPYLELILKTELGRPELTVGFYPDLRGAAAAAWADLHGPVAGMDLPPGTKRIPDCRRRAELCARALALGLEPIARGIAADQLALQDDPIVRMHFVREALRAGQPREWLFPWVLAALNGTDLANRRQQARALGGLLGRALTDVRAGREPVRYEGM